jgi:uncharacterized protein (AIM24 family)
LLIACVQRHEVPSGDDLVVDNGLFFAAHESTKMTLGIMGGAKTCCCGGVGFVFRFHGPAVVYTRTRNPMKLLRLVGGGGGGGGDSGGGGGGG